MALFFLCDDSTRMSNSPSSSQYLLFLFSIFFFLRFSSFWFFAFKIRMLEFFYQLFVIDDQFFRNFKNDLRRLVFCRTCLYKFHRCLWCCRHSVCWCVCVLQRLYLRHRLCWHLFISIYQLLVCSFVKMEIIVQLSIVLSQRLDLFNKSTFLFLEVHKAVFSYAHIFNIFAISRWWVFWFKRKSCSKLRAKFYSLVKTKDD